MLEWHKFDLIRAFNQRIEVYSQPHKAREFHDFFSSDITDEEISLLLTLANRNPRDLWHIFNALFHSQFALNANADTFSRGAYQEALSDFVKNFNYYEYYPRKKNARRNSMDIYSYINHLLKLSSPEFTANQLNQVAGTGSSTNNYIVAMQAMGLIVRTDTKIGAGSVYRINDSKIVYALQTGLRISRTS